VNVRGPWQILSVVFVAALLLGVAVPAVAAPKPTPAPTPAPSSSSPPPPSAPAVVVVTPTAVGNGKSGADYQEAGGLQTRAPVVPAVVTPPATTPAVTAPVVTQPAVSPPKTVPQADHGGGSQSIPRDGLVVLVAVLLAGLAVSVRAIRTRERRIGWALMAFCLVYLLVLGGLVSGVAGAASAPPAGVSATAGDGEILVSFDPLLTPGTTVSLARSALAPPADCVDGTADELLTGLTGPIVEAGLDNGTTYFYALCTDDGTSRSGSVAVSATPSAGVVVVSPVSAAHAAVGRQGVVISWRNPSGAAFDRAVVVRKFGSQPTSLTDGEVVVDAPVASLADHPLSTRRIWYAIYAANAEDTLSDPVFVSVAKFDPWLRSPYDGQIVGPRPVLSWKRRPGDYYDVQIFRASRSGRPINPSAPLIDAHPKTEHFRPTRRLRRGAYAWYVWAHAGGRFVLLGSQVFRVR
jgi:hypothetical protein